MKNPNRGFELKAMALTENEYLERIQLIDIKKNNQLTKNQQDRLEFLDSCVFKIQGFKKDFSRTLKKGRSLNKTRKIGRK